MNNCFSMRKFLVLLAFSMLSLAVANASDIPCSISGTAFNTPVNGTTVVTCGTLTFEGFEVLDATSNVGLINPGLIDIVGTTSSCPTCGSYYDPSSGVAYLEFNPNLQAGMDDEFIFTVLGGISTIDMTVGGQNASVQETACSTPFSQGTVGVGVCAPGDVLGQVTVLSNQAEQFANFTTTSPVYIFKDINAGGPPGQLTEFTQSFGPVGGTIPEPLSMLLMGSGLLGLGLLRRRSRKS